VRVVIGGGAAREALPQLTAQYVVTGLKDRGAVDQLLVGGQWGEIKITADPQF